MIGDGGGGDGGLIGDGGGNDGGGGDGGGGDGDGDGVAYDTDEYIISSMNTMLLSENI